MANKNNRRAKIVGTDIELDISEEKDIIEESHEDDHDHHHHKETFITKYIFSILIPISNQFFQTFSSCFAT